MSVNYGRDFIHGLQAGRELFIDKPRQARHQNQRMGLAQDANRRANQQMGWKAEDRQLTADQREGKQVSQTIHTAMFDENDRRKEPEAFTEADKWALIGGINSRSYEDWRKRHSITGEIKDGGFTPEGEVWLAFDKGDGQLAGHVVDSDTFYEDVVHEAIKINPDYADLQRQAQQRRQRVDDLDTVTGGGPGRASPEGLSGGRPQGQPQGQAQGQAQGQPPARGEFANSEYVGKVGHVESNWNGNAQNPDSSASGYFQWTDATAEQYGVERGDFESEMQGLERFLADNARVFEQRMGRAPEGRESYLMHQQGAGGGTSLLSRGDERAVDVVGERAVVDNGGHPDMTAQEFAEQQMAKYDAAPGGGEAQAYGLGAQSEIPETPSEKREARHEGLEGQIKAIGTHSGQTPGMQTAEIGPDTPPGQMQTAEIRPDTPPGQMQTAEQPNDGWAPPPEDFTLDQFYQDLSDEELVAAYRRETEKHRQVSGLGKGHSPEMEAIEAQMEQRGMPAGLRTGAQVGAMYSGLKSDIGGAVDGVTGSVGRAKERVGELTEPFRAGLRGTTPEALQAERQAKREEQSAGDEPPMQDEQIEAATQQVLQMGRGEGGPQQEEERRDLSGRDPAGAPNTTYGVSMTAKEHNALRRMAENKQITDEQFARYKRTGSLFEQETAGTGRWEHIRGDIWRSPDGAVVPQDVMLGALGYSGHAGESVDAKEAMDIQNRAEDRFINVVGLEEAPVFEQRRALGLFRTAAIASGRSLEDFMDNGPGSQLAQDAYGIQRAMEDDRGGPSGWGKKERHRSMTLAIQVAMAGGTKDNWQEYRDLVESRFHAPLQSAAGGDGLTPEQVDRYSGVIIQMTQAFGVPLEVAQRAVVTQGRESNWSVREIERFQQTFVESMRQREQ